MLTLLQESVSPTLGTEEAAWASYSSMIENPRKKYTQRQQIEIE